MRICINNIELNQLFSKVKTNLSKYLIHTKKQWEVYSKEGMFVVDHKDIYQLVIMNEKVEEFQHNSQHFMIDYSQITRMKVHRLPTDHISHFIQYQTYEMEANSKVKIVLKSFESQDKHYPLDAYFEIEDPTVDPKVYLLEKNLIDVLLLR
jgi:hypothetical protein